MLGSAPVEKAGVEPRRVALGSTPPESILAALPMRSGGGGVGRMDPLRVRSGWPTPPPLGGGGEAERLAKGVGSSATRISRRHASTCACKRMRVKGERDRTRARARAMVRVRVIGEGEGDR